MANKQVLHVINSKEYSELKDAIDHLLYNSNLPEPIQILLLENLKFQIQNDVWGDNES